MTIYNPITEAQWLVTFSKYGAFFFTEKDGGEVDSEISEFPNGTGMEIHNLTGPRKVSPITLKAPYDPRLQARLDPVITAWSCQPGTIIVTPVDCSGTPGTNPGGAAADISGLTGVTPTVVGEPYYYDGARLKKFTLPRVNRKSADAAMIELEFVVNSLRPRGKYNPGANATGGSSSILKDAQDFLKSNIA
jgi:hypothetical protein